MLTQYEQRGEPAKGATYRLTKAIPGYPEGYITDQRNRLLPRWLRMGIAERVSPDEAADAVRVKARRRRARVRAD